MFSIGCIFAELLDVLEPRYVGNSEKQNRRMLFSDSINYQLSNNLFQNLDDFVQFDFCTRE